MDELLKPQMINMIAVLILILTLLMLGLRSFKDNLNTYAVHSLLLAVVTGITGYNEGDSHIYFAATATIVIKVAIIPFLMTRLVSGMRRRRERDLLVSVPTSFIIAIGLMMLASSVSHALIGRPRPLTDILTVAVAISLIGMFLMVIRKDAVMQVIGLLTMENGFFLAGLVLTNGMPFFVEIGIFFDVLISGLLLWVYLKRMHSALKSTNTARLNQLRG